MAGLKAVNMRQRRHSIAGIPFHITLANVVSYWRVKGVFIEQNASGKITFRTIAIVTSELQASPSHPNVACQNQLLNGGELNADWPMIIATHSSGAAQTRARNVIIGPFSGGSINRLHAYNRLSGRLKRSRGVEHKIVAGRPVSVITERNTATLYVLGAQLVATATVEPERRLAQ